MVRANLHDGALTWLALGLIAAGTGCGGSSSKNGAGGAPGSGGTAGSSTGSGGAGASSGQGTGGSAAGSGGASGSGQSGGAGTGGVSGASSGGASGQAGSASAGEGGGSSECTPVCDVARDCCDGTCVNLQNDPKNCGDCGNQCEAGTYCTGGECVPPPCTETCAEGTQCCGAECCAAGELCCDPQGPIDMGPHCTAPSEEGTCPMGCAPLCDCASPDTRIATPSGERAIASLELGDEVYSVSDGAIRVVPILRVRRTPVSQHHVRRLRLATGAVLEISAGHPTADGRSFADLGAGTELDGATVVDSEMVPYGYPYTYDILPASDTGTYFAEGVLIGSTLFEAPRQ